MKLGKIIIFFININHFFQQHKPYFRQHKPRNRPFEPFWRLLRFAD